MRGPTCHGRSRTGDLGLRSPGGNTAAQDRYAQCVQTSDVEVDQNVDPELSRLERERLKTIPPDWAGWG
eukprot:8332393-Pyramimonas_sp.AAC.1